MSAVPTTTNVERKRLLEEILAKQSSLEQLLNKYHGQALVLIERQAKQAEEIKALLAITRSHERKLNMAIGGGSVLLALGAFLGWITDQAIKLLRK